jgi:hypothetical protein
MAIWRDLVDDHGFPAQCASVRRFVSTLRGPRPAEAHPVIVTAPGEEGQVDYGDGSMVRHPETGKYCRTRLFVFTLGCAFQPSWAVGTEHRAHADRRIVVGAQRRWLSSVVELGLLPSRGSF